MKKFVLIGISLFLGTCIANAGLDFDFSGAYAPFQVLQQDRFERGSAQYMQNRQRDAEEKAQDRYDDMDTIQIQRLKQAPKIDLNSNNKNPQGIDIIE